MAFAISPRRGNRLYRSSSMQAIMPSELDRLERPGPIEHPDAALEEPKPIYVGQLEIEEKVEDVVVLENETALFECKVCQDLKPTCTWHRDGNTLLSDDERISIMRNSAWYRLEIKQVTFSDQGIYTIECRHNKQYISIKAHLYVAPQQINRGVFYHNIAWAGTGVVKQMFNVKVSRGEKIVLEAEFRYNIEECVWYKNCDVILQDRRALMEHGERRASLTVTNAKPTDTGVYCVVVYTEQGYLSSFGDVQVSDCNEIRPVFPIIEEHLPDDLEAVVGEEVRLAFKAHIDADTIIRWERENIEVPSDCIRINYGSNYIGLIITNPEISTAGSYRAILQNREMQKTMCSSTEVAVCKPPECCREVDLLRPLESAVACCGAKVTFDCRFDLQDPIYYYVVWYVGHYKVERTNSHFIVICSGGEFLLHIKKLEASMAGDVICELRRSWPNRKSVIIQRAYARLVVVPLTMIQVAKTRDVIEGKLYYERDMDDVDVRIGEINDDSGYVAENMDPENLLKIAYCRLDEDGLHYLHVVRGLGTARNTSVTVQEINDGRVVIIKWNASTNPGRSCYIIELMQANGMYSEVGSTCLPYFKVKNPSLDRMMVFCIRSSDADPMSRVYDSDLVIRPPPEIIMRPPVFHEIQPMASFSSKYTKTKYLIGAGAFGSVKLVRDNDDGCYYAAKFVKARTEKSRDHALREFHIMKKFRHPKLIELVGFYESNHVLSFVMEFCWGGELFDRVIVEDYLKEVDVVGYVKQICQGLEYLHMNNIVHLDLKPENIICMSPNSRLVKLIDFGVARCVNEVTARAIYGTRDYVSPEIIDYEPISTASDMWSLGVVIYMLLSGVMPFAGQTWIEHSINISSARYDYDDYAFAEVSDLAKNFVDHLLVRQPRKRMSATQALRHKWIVEGPPQGRKAKHMNAMRQNLKTYMASYCSKWQRAGNVMIAARRLRMRMPLMSAQPLRGGPAKKPSDGDSPELAFDDN